MSNCSTEALSPHLQQKQEPQIASKVPRDTCESKDERSSRSQSDSHDDDSATLPGVWTYATDSGDDESASDKKDWEEEEKKPRSSQSDELKHDWEQGILQHTGEVFLHQGSGVPPCSCGSSNSGKDACPVGDR